jgi:hypothetical protein
MNKWRAIIALVVAFVLGVGAGGLVEHQRAKSKSDKKSTSPTTGGKATAVGARWFPNPPAAACPDILKWQAAGATAYADLLKKQPWPATQTALEAQSATTTTELKALLHHANKTGRRGLNILLRRETKNLAALKAAKDLNAYVAATKPLATPLVKRGNAVMGKAKTACAGGTTTTTAKSTT